MKIGIFSDVHGNFIALSHCMKRMEALKVDKIYFLGDAVGYMPDGDAVISDLMKKGVKCIKGNHEAMLLGMIAYQQERESIYQLRETYETIHPVRRKHVAEWPELIETNFGDKNVLLIHGGIADPLLQYIYPDSNLNSFLSTDFDIVFMGHTHYPFRRRIGDKLIINVGSCGLPRDQGDLMSFVVYDSQTNECKIIRCYFDGEAVMSKYTAIHSSVQACLKRQTREFVFDELIE